MSIDIDDRDDCEDALDELRSSIAYYKQSRDRILSDMVKIGMPQDKLQVARSLATRTDDAIEVELSHFANHPDDCATCHDVINATHSLEAEFAVFAERQFFFYGAVRGAMRQ